MTSLTTYQSSFAEALIAAKVEFVVVGGMAMRAHGIIRETQDLDLLVSRTRLNAERLLPVLASCLAIPNTRLTVDVLQLPKKLLSLPNSEPKTKEVDVLTSMGTLDFELTAQRAVPVRFGLLVLQVIGLEELLYTKLVSASSTLDSVAQERDLSDFETILSHWKCSPAR